MVDLHLLQLYINTYFKIKKKVLRTGTLSIVISAACAAWVVGT